MLLVRFTFIRLYLSSWRARTVVRLHYNTWSSLSQCLIWRRCMTLRFTIIILYDLIYQLFSYFFSDLISFNFFNISNLAPQFMLWNLLNYFLSSKALPIWEVPWLQVSGGQLVKPQVWNDVSLVLIWCYLEQCHRNNVIWNNVIR